MIVYETALPQSRCVGSEVKRMLREPDYDLNYPRNISNNLALGQPRSSELRAINRHHANCKFVFVYNMCGDIYEEFLMNHLHASQHVWEVKKTLRDTGSKTLINRGMYRTTWRRGSRGRQSWRQSIDTTKFVNAGFICEVVCMGFALSNSFVLVKIYENYNML